MLNQYGWLWFNLIINLIYIIDAFMLFFRAYYDEEGMLVYELKKIARNYGCSRQFILNFISCFPTQAVLYGLDRSVFNTDPDVTNESFLLFTLIDLIKLLRLTRVSSLTKSSTYIQTFWEKQSIPKVMLVVFVGKMILFSHFLACFWSFVAFAQVQSFNFTAEGAPPTWISAWYYDSIGTVSINPIGWSNDIDRYALSLFWAIQSITSIGYGNIVPVSRVEYYIANMLMLVSGVFWAYAIGNIIQILDHVHSCEMFYKVKMDSANTLINSFSPIDPDREPDYGVGDAEVLASRIRRFLTAQYNKTSRINPNSEFNSKKLEEVYPLIDHLSPELRQLTSLHLYRGVLERIPYLSSKYLSPSEQSEVAFKCVFIEFGRGETFYEHSQYGRGLVVLKKGFCMATRKSKPKEKRWYARGEPIGINDVLVDGDFLGRDEKRRLTFYSYSLALYIPRSVIMEVLKKKPGIWKDCARWHYLQACLLKWAREKSKRELP